MLKLCKALTGVLLVIFVSGHAYATPNREALSKVVYQVAAEDWVKAQDAKVIVQVNAAVTQQGLNAVRNSVTQNMQKIAKSDWQITRFDRTKDSSGLERVIINAESRIPENQLLSIRSTVQRLSKPGEKYQIQNIDFTPSLAATEKTRVQVRIKLINEINQQLEQFNKSMPGGGYSVHTINFIPGLQAAPQYRQSKRMMAMSTADSPASPSLTVSQKVTMQARVVFAKPMQAGA